MDSKQQIFQHYSQILNSLLDRSIWFKSYFQAPWQLDNSLEGQYNDEMDNNISLYTGATRGCLVDSTYDWVIKFDIDEDALGSGCEREIKIYSAAQKANLEQYLSEVIDLGVYTHTIDFYELYDIEQAYNFYEEPGDAFNIGFNRIKDELGEIHPITISIHLFAYRRADHFFSSNSNISKEEKNIACSIASPLRSRYLSIAVDFIRFYGVEEYKKFSRFCMEKSINDLHFSNIGFINGSLCLIDYSGYHSEYDDFDENTDWMHSDSEESEDGSF